MKLLIVSGMSGAGKSMVADTLEDLGYYCVDNMPVLLIPTFTKLCLESGDRYQKVALVADTRAVMDADLLLEQIAHAAEDGVDCEILFLDCDVPTLINRYKETRRRHPLDNGCGVSAAINLEHDVMEKLKNSAHYVIDTTSFSPQRLKKHIRQLFGAEGGHFVISIISFGFKHGIPTEADTVFDVRFLPNPFYDVQLRPLTGENGAVRDYVFRGGMAEQFMGYVHEMLDFLIPQYKEGERSSFVVAIGCTGGQHRSVACACELADYLRLKGNDVILVHRDAQKAR